MKNKFFAGFVVGFILAVALIWTANYVISRQDVNNQEQKIQLNGSLQVEVLHV